MNDRRVALGLQWVDVARRAVTARGNPMSVQNLLRIRKGDVDVTDMAADQIERALEWAPGSVAKTLKGGEPTIRDSQTGSSFNPVTATAAQTVALLARIHETYGDDEVFEAMERIVDKRREARESSHRTA
jgi:hypothetical protein